MRKISARKYELFILLLLSTFGLCVGSQVADADPYDHDAILDYIWEPASGPVHHYNIYTSVDEGEFEMVGTTPDATPAYALTGAKDRATYRLKVQAVDAEGNTGPCSDASEPTTVFLQEGSTPLQDRDIDGNRQIDIFDLVIVGKHFGAQIPPGTALNPDINRDGVVNILDLVLVGQGFGKRYEANPAAPDAGLAAAETVQLAFRPQMLADGVLLVEITADSRGELYGFQLDVDFDPNRFEAVTVEEGQLLKKNGGRTYWHAPSVENETGHISKIASSRIGHEGVRGQDTLLHMAFRVKNTSLLGQDTSPLSPPPVALSNVKLANVQGQRLAFTISTFLDWGKLIPPKRTVLMPNYPNPFNPETWIPYALSQDSDVQMYIYNLSGQLVRAFDLGYQSAGWYNSRESAVYWDGRNTLGEAVASGVYVYQLVTSHFQQMRRMVVLK